MKPLVECVPNFSEGRRPEVVKAIAAAIAAVPGVRVLDHEADANHNRCVITFVGDPEAALRGAFEGAKTAVTLIDMETHTGEHPRVGAMDVCPFVPISGVTLEDCVSLARRLGERVAGGLGGPGYFYEAAATSGRGSTKASRRRLRRTRRGPQTWDRSGFIPPPARPSSARGPR